MAIYMQEKKNHKLDCSFFHTFLCNWNLLAGVVCTSWFIRPVKFFTSSKPLFYNWRWSNIWKYGKIAIELKIIIFNLFIKFKFKKISPLDLIVQFYNRNISCQKYSFKQHWYQWSTFQDASFSPQESPKFSRFEKFKDMTNLTQIFQIWS